MFTKNIALFCKKEVVDRLLYDDESDDFLFDRYLPSTKHFLQDLSDTLVMSPKNSQDEDEGVIQDLIDYLSRIKKEQNRQYNYEELLNQIALAKVKLADNFYLPKVFMLEQVIKDFIDTYYPNMIKQRAKDDFEQNILDDELPGRPLFDDNFKNKIKKFFSAEELKKTELQDIISYMEKIKIKPSLRYNYSKLKQLIQNAKGVVSDTKLEKVSAKIAKYFYDCQPLLLKTQFFQGKFFRKFIGVVDLYDLHLFFKNAQETLQSCLQKLQLQLKPYNEVQLVLTNELGVNEIKNIVEILKSNGFNVSDKIIVHSQHEDTSLKDKLSVADHDELAFIAFATEIENIPDENTCGKYDRQNNPCVRMIAN